MSNTASFLNQLTKEEPVIPKVYSKKVLSNGTRKKLLAYQECHVVKLISILLTRYIVLDSSDTGIGKTYIAAAICKELKRRPIIICPKTLMFNWKSVLSFFKVKPYDIVNYETIKNGKTYKDDECKYRIKSPFIDVVEFDPEEPAKFLYNWNIPEDAILIFDEAHRCKEPNTNNGKLLASIKPLIENKMPIMLLSATICEKIADMKIPFFLFGMIPNTRAYNHHVLKLKDKYARHQVRKSNYLTAADYRVARDNAQAMMIYEEIKEYASRIKIKELGDMFPSNQICCQQFMINDIGKVKEAYAQMAVLLEELRTCPKKNHLCEIQKLKQEIELQKVPIFIEQAQLYLEEGKSVIIFVNYTATLRLIVEALNIRCIVNGGQTISERLKCIDLFQSNQERIIICQMRAGGVGINLHDLHGDHPRVTLLNFSDSAANLLQALGRAPRAGAKSPVLQRIIFVANVDYEKDIMRNINRKLTNISVINDGDLEGNKYKVKRITRKVVTRNSNIVL